MDLFREFMDENYRTVAVAGLAISTISFAAIFIRRRLRERPPKLFPPDTVILHQIGRGPHAPSLTPFAVKLETYLRMAKIPYENVHSYQLSSKGKVPWAEYNGEVLADSSFIIQHLNRERKLDLNQHLSPADRAVARAFQKMTEENLYWCLALFRWSYGTYDQQPLFKRAKVSRFFRWMVGRKVRQATWAQGIGRHSEEEVLQIATEDMKALSDFLGDKTFMFGEKACEEDCAIFGMLSQVMWHSPGNPLSKTLFREFPNLVRYCEKMKDTYWSDWESCITHEEPLDPSE